MNKRSRSYTKWNLSDGSALAIEPKTLRKGDTVFRCHSRFLQDGTPQGSWYFSSSSGRFDLSAPEGTPNTAEDRFGAVLESFSSLLVGRSWVRREEVASRTLVALEIPTAAELTDLRSGSALMAGVVPGELTGGYGSYIRTQSLAAVVHSSQRAGLAAPLRFGSAFRQDGCYIFGESGPQNFPAGQELAISTALGEMGYVIVDSPTSTEITLMS